jgi:hypothetical protein
MGGMWEIGGIFWNRNRAETERKDQKQLEIETKLANIDRAKRWDLQGDDDAQS